MPLREHFRHVGMMLSQHFLDCFRINGNTNLTGQISDQFSGIHSGNLETEKQFCFDIAPDRHFIDMMSAPKCHWYCLYSVTETSQFLKFICFQKSLLRRMKCCPHRNFNGSHTFVLCWMALTVIRAVLARS